MTADQSVDLGPMYAPQPPVEVGEWVRFEESGWPEVDYIRVERLTAKLVYADGMPFSRVHGAYFDVGFYNAYAGRIRKITEEDHPAIAKLYVEGKLSEGQAARATGLDRVTLRKMADDLILSRAPGAPPCRLTCSTAPNNATTDG